MAALLLACVLSPEKAFAQQTLFVQTCGTFPRTVVPGSAGILTVDVNGVLCSNATGGSGGTVATATVTPVNSSASSVQILAANAARKGAIFTNTDANGVYVKFGTTASAASFTVLIGPGGYWEMPNPIYTGRIDAIWTAAGSGALVVTEL